ncbi:MAG: fold metallo-hydrolase [Betaproteobacteria bacterium]|nr:fold metallo-hydrolase [Betaproteobacteria bacterium]
MMRFASLGSGSEGNGLLIEVGTSRILVDCGFGLADTIERLARLDVTAESLDAILITHEHDDHVGGAARLARKFNIPVWITHGSHQAAAKLLGNVDEIRIFDCHQRFSVGSIEIEPYTVPHDAREPSQFVFSDGASRIGLLTDAGSLTPHMQAVLSGLDALVLECNHDLDMLWGSAYPHRLKERIAGRFGHLDNQMAAQLLSLIDCSRLKHLVAAHLSKQNNTPELARSALAQALNCELDWVGVATQNDGFGWRQVG